jgi:hypothetical protein
LVTIPITSCGTLPPNTSYGAFVITNDASVQIGTTYCGGSCSGSSSTSTYGSLYATNTYNTYSGWTTALSGPSITRENVFVNVQSISNEWVVAGSGVSSGSTGGSGGGSIGFSNPMTTLGDLLYGGTSGAATRLAGQTAANTYVLSQVGTGTASAAPTWSLATGSGNVVFSNSPTMVSPTWSGGASGDSLSLSGPATGISGLGGQFYAMGATAQVGTSSTAASCVSGVVCDSLAGTFSFTTGTGTLSAGNIVTITMPGTRVHTPSCPVSALGAYGWYSTASNSGGTVTVIISTTIALSPSTTYTVAMWCGGN